MGAFIPVAGMQPYRSAGGRAGGSEPTDIGGCVQHAMVEIELAGGQGAAHVEGCLTIPPNYIQEGAVSAWLRGGWGVGLT